MRSSARGRCAIGWVLFLVLALACSGRVVAERQVGSNRIEIRGSSEVYADDLTRILDRVSSAIEDASRILPIDDLVLTVGLDARRSMPGYGVGGHTPDASTVWLSLDPEMSGIPDLIDERLPRMVIRELHHAVRWRDPGYGKTLLGAMVSEGLADHFVLQVRGGEPAPWNRALSAAQTASLRERAAAGLDSIPYRHRAWFFGSDPEIPNWAGYSLGFALVSAQLAAHPEASAASLVHAPAEVFRPNW